MGMVGPEGSYKRFENKRLEQCETFFHLYIFQSLIKVLVPPNHGDKHV